MHDEVGDDFDLEIEWEILKSTIVATLYLNNRVWDMGGELRVPSQNELEAKTRELIEGVREFGGGTYLTLNGLKVYKDPEFPDSYEIYLKVGHASPRIPEGSK